MPDTSLDPLVAEDVQRLIDRHRATGSEPGLSFGVIRGAELVLSGGHGEYRPGAGAPGVDTVFRIASMTKSFTAATVLLLRDERLLRLDDEAVTYLPELAALRLPTCDAPPLTVRNLLTMTAGFPTDDPWGDRQQDLPDEAFTELLAGGLSFAWIPGTAFEYSNLSYALLGRIIAAAAAEPYQDVVTRRLLEPLGMTSTVFTDDAVPIERLAQGYRKTDPSHRPGWQEVPFAGYGSFAPMGGLFSSVRDLTRWMGGLASAFAPHDAPDADRFRDHPIQRSSRRELQFPHITQLPIVTWRSVAEPPVVRGVAYGFGLVVERDPRYGTLVGHSGGYPGFGSHMRWHPATGLGVVVLGNATYTPLQRLGSQLMDALLAGHPGRGADVRSPSFTAGSAGMTAATARARTDVNRLINHWDDDLAARLLAMNVDLDEPLEVRRRTFASIATRIGPLAPDDDTPPLALSPAHCCWWLRGPGGRVRVEIRLSPERPPRVQTLTVAAVPTPSAQLRRIAERVAATLGRQVAGWPAEVPLAASVSTADLTRQLRVAGVWAGTAVVAEDLDGDGRSEATFRLAGERLDLHLTVSLDTDNGVVTALALTPAPVQRSVT